MRYGKIWAGILLSVAMLLPVTPAGAYDPDDEIVTVVQGDEEKEVKLKADTEPQYSKPPAGEIHPSDKSRADEWFEAPAEEAKADETKGKPVKERYLKILRDESGFTYYLDMQGPEGKQELYPDFEPVYLEEFISLAGNRELLLNHIRLTGGVKLTEVLDLAENGEKVRFETKDIAGNSVKSEDLFSDRPVTMINL
jgi:hypothetical protein